MKRLFMVLAATLICGSCLFTSCKKDDLNLEEMSYEWWEIASVAGGQMQWTALRKNADGTTFQQGVKWVKVN